MSVIVSPWSVCKGCYKMSGGWPDKDGDDGPGVNTDFILYVSAKNTSSCGPQSIAYASYCQLERALDRYICSTVYLVQANLNCSVTESLLSLEFSIQFIHPNTQALPNVMRIHYKLLLGRFGQQMFRMGLATDPSCSCGCAVQTAHHAIYDCPITKCPGDLTTLDLRARDWLHSTQLNL